ncbi:MAG TPA: hypothetical protein VJM46_04795 [Candidatus Saccharimonadales bacterium]|nr:hypothetical protein [Candidatus Saccharimonadales bacterium]
MWGKVRSILVDFSGIWATLVILASLLNITIDLNNNVWRYVVVGLLILLLAGNVFTSTRQLRSARAKRIMDRTLGNEQEKADKTLTASIVTLPTQSVLESAYFLLVERAKQWSDDSSIGSFSFMNSYHGDMTPTESFDLTYSSSWKGLVCTAKFANYMEKGEVSERFEKERDSMFKKRPVEQPFFAVMPNWQKAMRAAIDSVSEELDGASSIVVSMYDSADYARSEQKAPYASIYIRYDKGKMESSKLFRFDGTVLSDTDSGKKITIK